MANNQEQQNLAELQALLAKQQQEIEAFKKEKETLVEQVKTKKSAKNDIFAEIESRLGNENPNPDVTFLVDIVAMFVEKVVKETGYRPDTSRFAQTDLDMALRIFGYLDNAKIFSPTKSSSKTKYQFDGFTDLPANDYVKYYLTEKVEETSTKLSPEDF